MLTELQIKNVLASGNLKALTLLKDYLDSLKADKAKASFREFVTTFWPIVATSPLRNDYYVDVVCDHLQHLTELKRLVISLPPRHGKSTIASVLYPAWFLLQKPSTKFLCASYSLKDLSIRDSIACRNVIESPDYQRWWSHVFKLRSDDNRQSKYSTDVQGYRMAVSPESACTGLGADCLLADDLNNVATVGSPTERTAVLSWWQQVVSTRLNPFGLDLKVVIANRCHEEDIIGHVKKHDTGEWQWLTLPYEYDPERRAVTSLPWADPRTEPGQPLSTLLTPQKVLELKGGNGLGPTGFACQFNQRPAPAEGNVFQKAWFLNYKDAGDLWLLDGVKVAKTTCRTFIVTDLAISLKSQADWTVAQVWQVTPHNHLLLVDQWRDRVEGPDAVKAFRRLCEQYKPDALWIEDVAFQRLMIQLCRQQGLPVKALSTGGQDKKARCQRSLIKAECGQVWLPERASWLSEWMSEVETFPNGAKDDQVDCLAWAGIVAAKYPCRELPPVETPEEQAKRMEEERQRREQEFLWGD